MRKTNDAATDLTRTCTKCAVHTWIAVDLGIVCSSIGLYCRRTHGCLDTIVDATVNWPEILKYKFVNNKMLACESFNVASDASQRQIYRHVIVSGGNPLNASPP